jgi:VWFA-related protein
MKQNLIRKPLTSALILFFAVLPALTQNPNTDAKQTAPALSYSESIPYQPREFPGNKKSKPKKEKKSEKNKQETDKTSNASVSPFEKDETITIPVSVFDAEGRFVTNLKQSDFKIFTDDKEQEILSVGKRDEPVNIILLIDTSPSTTYKIEEIQDYALATVERLKPEDKVMVIEFNEKIKVLAELTADRQIITKAIRSAKFGEGTSLYEAVKTTFSKYVSLLSGQTTVVLLTDGVDTTSRRANYAESLLAVEKTNAMVFPIYFNTFDDLTKAVKKNKTPFPSILGGGSLTLPSLLTQGSTAADYEIGKMYLYDISKLSGGRSRVIKNITDKRAEDVDNIGGERRAQYQVTFRPSDFADGQRKQIKVRINRPNLNVQARGSLIVGGNKRMQISEERKK